MIRADRGTVMHSSKPNVALLQACDLLLLVLYIAMNAVSHFAAFDSLLTVLQFVLNILYRQFDKSNNEECPAYRGCCGQLDSLCW
jgi:hypothetical protein